MWSTRVISDVTDERVAALKSIAKHSLSGSTLVTVDDLEYALHAAEIACSAQGFALIKNASGGFGGGFSVTACAGIWRGGCIIRADFLNDIASHHTAQTAISYNSLLHESRARGD
jgi:6-phosphogluconate dehydrogenase